MRMSQSLFYHKIYIYSSNTSTTFYKVYTGYMFRPSWAIIRLYIWTGSFGFSAFWHPIRNEGNEILL